MMGNEYLMAVRQHPKVRELKKHMAYKYCLPATVLYFELLKYIFFCLFDCSITLLIFSEPICNSDELGTVSLMHTFVTA